MNSPDQDSDGPDVAAAMRMAMRRMPSSVALITTRDPVTGAPAGLAASAVIPVSMEPPSMLISVNRAASAHDCIVRASRFCINLMAVEQAPMIETFSTSAFRDRRFAESCWRDHQGLPWVEAAPASLFCELRERLSFGTHDLFVGELFDVFVTAGAEPVAWLEGTIARLSLDPPKRDAIRASA